jgi:hypothetical protein
MTARVPVLSTSTQALLERLDRVLDDPAHQPGDEVAENRLMAQHVRSTTSLENPGSPLFGEPELKLAFVELCELIRSRSK